jgi:hypothetical protein
MRTKQEACNAIHALHITEFRGRPRRQFALPQAERRHGERDAHGPWQREQSIISA